MMCDEGASPSLTSFHISFGIGVEKFHSDSHQLFYSVSGGPCIALERPVRKGMSVHWLTASTVNP